MSNNNERHFDSVWYDNSCTFWKKNIPHELWCISLCVSVWLLYMKYKSERVIKWTRGVKWREKKNHYRILILMTTHIKTLTHLPEPPKNTSTQIVICWCFFICTSPQTTLHFNSINICPVRRHHHIDDGRMLLAVWTVNVFADFIFTSHVFIIVVGVGAINANKVIAEQFFSLFRCMLYDLFIKIKWRNVIKNFNRKNI